LTFPSTFPLTFPLTLVLTLTLASDTLEGMVSNHMELAQSDN
jgi:hypothetical protein